MSFSLGEPYDSEIAQLRTELSRRPQRREDQMRRIHSAIRSVRLRAARERARHTDEQWQLIIVEFGYRCVRCGVRFTESGDRPVKDHVTPIYQGGSDGAENLQPLCMQCNGAKGPETFHWANYRRAYGFGE